MKTSGGWLTVEDARTALAGYRDQISKIIAAIPSEREFAYESARNLKSAVTSYYKRPARFKGSMSDIEARFFDPCMHRVFVALQKLNLH